MVTALADITWFIVDKIMILTNLGLVTIDTIESQHMKETNGSKCRRVLLSEKN